VCIRIFLLGHYIVAEAMCNWFHHDINIFSLLKKYAKQTNELLVGNEKCTR
jgi:hypothetical protein